MYAIVRTGGKQYRVEEGDQLRVATLDGAVGDAITLEDVVASGAGSELLFGAAASAVSVNARITEHGRGKKVVVFKKRRRKNYRLTQGHRQNYTAITITGINSSDITD
ncbi:MAG: 50S ribosomal protein L21 [Mariprofundales bacterium]|nr:50S ribosomal protein L21 [Mariprofundales bacterium]